MRVGARNNTRIICLLAILLFERLLIMRYNKEIKNKKKFVIECYKFHLLRGYVY